MLFSSNASFIKLFDCSMSELDEGMNYNIKDVLILNLGRLRAFGLVAKSLKKFVEEEVQKRKACLSFLFLVK
jgi:hypothetical protein